MRHFSETEWEKKFSYCRAQQMGSQVAVSGTVAVGGGSAREQTLAILSKIEASLRPFGLNRTHIIRTRMFVTDISLAEDFGLAHGEFFRGSEPCTSMIGVAALISPEFLIEIEADAVVPSSRPPSSAS